MEKKYSELRQDLVSGDWILIAPGRFRYQKFLKGKHARLVTPLSKCPFEDLKGHEIVLQYDAPHKGFASGQQGKKTSNWEISVVKNKYPVIFHQNIVPRITRHGSYETMPGIGYHDIVITRDHRKNFPKLSEEKAFHVFEVFRDRYLTLLGDKNLAYISIFHNWGPRSGASVYHPHYQLIGLPVVPPDIGHSLQGSARYFKKHHTCVHCVMIAEERKLKKRIIAENKTAIAFAPFVSQNPFEVRVFPKRHLPYFEGTFDDDELQGVSEVLQKVLWRMEIRLNDPDYNFFLHTAPLKDKARHKHYHWHIEVYPRLTTYGGFEFDTGVKINPVNPDIAAKILRK